MRILYWTAFYWPYIGGMEVIGARLVTGLRRRGHDVRVVTSHGHLDLPDEDERDGVPIYRLPFHRAVETRDPLLMLRAQHQLARLKREFRPDVVHVNPSDPSIVFHLRTAAAHPAKVLASIHVPVRAPLYGPDTLLGRTVRTADWVTTVSAAQLATLRAVAPEVAPISSVILNGGDVPALAPAPLPTDAPRLLCVGRVVPEKGFDVAVAAFASLAARWPALRLVIAGDGPERGALATQARALGVADRTEFIGWVPPGRVHALMNQATVVLMPSRWEEPFGLVAMEAAQMARPVVASRVGGLPEVVADGETGVLVPADDPAALASAAESLLEHPGLAARMGRAARERALAVFAGDRCVDAYDDLYRHLTEEAVHADAG